MHRQSQEEVAAAARRRLELLGRELEQAGLRRVDSDDDNRSAPRAAAGLPEPGVVPPVGRHVRPPRAGVALRLAAWVGQQLPDTLRGSTELGSGPALLVVALVALALAGTVVVVLRMHASSEPVPAGTSAVQPGATAAGVPGVPRPSASPSASGAAD